MNISKKLYEFDLNQRPEGAKRLIAGLLLGTMLAGTLGLGITPASAQAPESVVMEAPALTAEEQRVRSQAMKSGPMAKAGESLAKLYDDHQIYLRVSEAQAFRAADSSMKVRGDSVIVEAVANGDTDGLVRDLEAAGMTEISVSGPLVGGQLPIEAIPDVAAMENLRFMRPSQAMTHIGSVTSEASRSLLAGRLRQILGVQGRRVTVGVLSDSFDCLGGAAADFASRDLPSTNRTNILQEPDCDALGANFIDEGRAMMQLIRDVAPFARQAFHTAFISIPDFANGIRELADENGGDADIIVDDVIYFAEPMFQDGEIAQAVDDVHAQGVPYFSSAGNNWRNAWETDNDGFESAGTNGFSGLQHDFRTGSGRDGRMTFQFHPGDTLFVLQWDEPYPSAGSNKGSRSDVDLIFYRPGTNIVEDAALNNEIGADPTIVFEYENNTGGLVQLEIAIELVNGPAPRFMKMVWFGGPQSFPVEYDTFSGTLYGHANARGAIATGAARYDQTPKFGVSPPVLEPFSSAGGTPILFNKNGGRLSDPEIREKPEIVSVDGTITTFFGQGNRFFGTSAAAPHAAAVGALMMEIDPGITPRQMENFMTKTAIDMDDPFTNGFDNGFDSGTGYGLLNALRAGRRADKLK